MALGILASSHDSLLQFMTTAYKVKNVFHPWLAYLGSFFLAIIYGTVLGLSDYFVFKKWAIGKSQGVIIIIKGIYYFVILAIVFMFIRHVYWDYFVLPQSVELRLLINEETWSHLFKFLAIYTLAMGLVVSFINQMNQRFGPGILIPLLLGKYHRPHKEERIFIFLDLKSSTSIAEKLGHIQYSELIRNCFQDINLATSHYQAEIYQYVGDEVVLSWPVHDDTNPLVVIDFYFECKETFEGKRDFYLGQFGVVPEFKAGAHIGWVTGVEVGEIKREMAFHGDTINVAARIQGLCNEYDADLMISSELRSRTTFKTRYNCTRIDDVDLKGKKEKLDLYRISAVQLETKSQ